MHPKSLNVQPHPARAQKDICGLDTNTSTVIVKMYVQVIAVLAQKYNACVKTSAISVV